MPKKTAQEETKNSKSVKKPVTRSSEATRNAKVVVKIKHLFARRDPAIKRNQEGTRLLQTPARYWYNPLTWHHSPPVPDYKSIAKARQIFWAVLVQLWVNKGLFSGIVVIFGVLNLILVRTLSGSNDLAALKGTLDGAFHGAFGKVASSAVSFTYLLTTSDSGNTGTSGVYQGILLITCSLAFIWALRQVIAKHRVRVRDSFYLGMYPLVPFVLVFLLMCVQLLPLALGGSFYAAVISNGIAVNLWEKVLSLLIFILLGLWSLRMITASIFALYIVTLPEMAPLRAYRTARQLVYGRRLLIWRKLIFLPIVMLLLAAAIEVPLIYFVTPIAEWSFFVLSMVALPIVHGYMYNLYREML